MRYRVPHGGTVNFLFRHESAATTSEEIEKKLRHVQIALEYSREGLLELLIGECVAERIHRAVGVAQEVREHVEMLVRAGRIRAEALDQRQNVVGRPAGDESTENERDGSEGLARPVLGSGLLTTHSWILLLRFGFEPLTDCLDQVTPRASSSAVRSFARLGVALTRLPLDILLLRLLLLQGTKLPCIVADHSNSPCDSVIDHLNPRITPNYLEGMSEPW